MNREKAKALGHRLEKLPDHWPRGGSLIQNDRLGIFAVVVTPSSKEDKEAWICTEEGDFLPLVPSGDQDALGWFEDFLTGDAWIDLRDPASLGCLLDAVRDAHGHCAETPVIVGLDYNADAPGVVSVVRVMSGGSILVAEPISYGPTEALALLVAIEPAA